MEVSIHVITLPLSPMKRFAHTLTKNSHGKQKTNSKEDKEEDGEFSQKKTIPMKKNPMKKNPMIMKKNPMEKRSTILLKLEMRRDLTIASLS